MVSREASPEASGLSQLRARPAEVQALYETLRAECQRCLDAVHQQQRLSVGRIPGLIEQLVEQLRLPDGEMGRLGTSGERSFSLATHTVNVAILSLRVGIEVGMKPLELIDVGIAALLHDIGMLKVSHLLHLPAHLNPQQREEFNAHPLWGERLAQGCADLPPVVCEVIAQEHERQDGTGYPRQLQGSEIHPYAQLIGLLDVYESLTHDRPYRQRLVPAQASRIVCEQHRRAFQRELLRAFLKALPVYPIGSWVQLSSGELAQVVVSSRHNPLRPTVRVVIDREGQPYARSQLLELANEPRMSVAQAIPEPVGGPTSWLGETAHVA